ncbi:MAG: TetR/AcrR family transcriptional regulator, partial [Bacteroidota bacterium]
MSLSKTRRKEDIEKFKKIVLDTAVQLMREKKEWGQVSVNKIANIMRYTPPNIYHYFENKDDILFHLCQRGSTIIGRKLKT